MPSSATAPAAAPATDEIPPIANANANANGNGNGNGNGETSLGGCTAAAWKTRSPEPVQGPTGRRRRSHQRNGAADEAAPPHAAIISEAQLPPTGSVVA